MTTIAAIAAFALLSDDGAVHRAYNYERLLSGMSDVIVVQAWAPEMVTSDLPNPEFYESRMHTLLFAAKMHPEHQILNPSQTDTQAVARSIKQADMPTLEMTVVCNWEVEDGMAINTHGYSYSVHMVLTKRAKVPRESGLGQFWYLPAQYWECTTVGYAPKLKIRQALEQAVQWSADTFVADFTKANPKRVSQK